MDFLSSLRSLLDTAGPIAKAERDQAIEMIRLHSFAYLRRDGPCLNCGKPINYGEPDAARKQFGDEWLDRLFVLWRNESQREIKVYKGRVIKFISQGEDKYPKSIAQYLCEECHAKLARE